MRNNSIEQLMRDLQSAAPILLPNHRAYLRKRLMTKHATQKLLQNAAIAILHNKAKSVSRRIVSLGLAIAIAIGILLGLCILLPTNSSGSGHKFIAKTPLAPLSKSPESHLPVDPPVSASTSPPAPPVVANTQKKNGAAYTELQAAAMPARPVAFQPTASPLPGSAAPQPIPIEPGPIDGSFIDIDIHIGVAAIIGRGNDDASSDDEKQRSDKTFIVSLPTGKAKPAAEQPSGLN